MKDAHGPGKPASDLKRASRPDLNGLTDLQTHHITSEMQKNEPNLSADKQLRALDQLRQRLQQASRALSSMRGDLERSDPLPPW